MASARQRQKQGRQREREREYWCLCCVFGVIERERERRERERRVGAWADSVGVSFLTVDPTVIYQSTLPDKDLHTHWVSECLYGKREKQTSAWVIYKSSGPITKNLSELNSAELDFLLSSLLFLSIFNHEQHFTVHSNSTSNTLFFN